MARFVSVEQAAAALRAAWGRETSYAPTEWSPGIPSLGQCAVTALVMQDLFGGTLVRARVNGEEHYWNLLADGSEIDITKDQFGEIESKEPMPHVSREFVLSYPETKRRYLTLRESVMAALDKSVTEDNPLSWVF